MSMAVKGHHAHLKGRTIYTNDVGIDLLCLLYGVPTTSESGQAEARYPAFFLCGSKHYFNSSEFGYLTGAKRVMMRDTILKIINEIRQTKGLVVLESIKDEQTLRNDLELTSFDLAELTVKIEDEYDIDIFEDGLVNTVGEIFAKLEK